MCQVFEPESHPETGTFDSWIVFYQRFKFFMVNHIRFFWSNLRVVQRHVNLVRVSFNPFAIFPVFSTLRNFADIDFRIKISGKSLTMVAGITVHDIKVLNFVEVMFSGISSINAGYAGVETTTKNCC